jgi:hypothetical protein
MLSDRGAFEWWRSVRKLSTLPGLVASRLADQLTQRSERMRVKKSADSVSVEAAQLQVLMLDYEQAREEERHYTAQQTTLIAITLTAVTLAAAIGFNSGSGEIKVPADWHDPVFFVTPLLAVVPLLFLIQIGTTAIWRSYYIRALEREIRALLHRTEVTAYPKLPALSYGEMYIVESAGRGRGSPGVIKVLVSIAYPVIVLVVGGLAVAMATQVDNVSLRLLMFLVYGAGAIALIGHVARVHLRGRAVFNQQVAVLVDRLERDLLPGERDDERSRHPLSYFILPRPDELATKSIFLVLGVFLALTQLPTISWAVLDDWGNILVLWVAVEFLIYQARYQWNDIVGMAEDQKSTTAASRGRLPVFPGSRPLSWVVILVRFYLVVVLAALPLANGSWGIHLTPAVWIGLVAIVVTAILYELVRWWGRARRRASWFHLVVLCTVVGLGYAVRVAIGFVATGGAVGPPLAFGAAVAWALGVYFVTLNWVIEASWNFEWDASSRSRAVGVVQKADDTKPHLYELLRRTKATLPPSTAEADPALRALRPSARITMRLIEAPRMPFLPFGAIVGAWFVVVGAGTGVLLNLPVGDRGGVLLAGGVCAALIAAFPSNGVKHLVKLACAGLLMAAVNFYVFVFAAGAITEALVWVRVSVSFLFALAPLILFASFSTLDYNATRSFVAKLGMRIQMLGLFVYEAASGIDPRPRWRKGDKPS